MRSSVLLSGRVSSILIEDDGVEQVTSQTRMTCMNELSSLQMTMTVLATHESYHAVTAPT